MTDRLSATKALEDAAVWLRSAEELWNSNEDRVQARAAADMANAYATYATAYTLVQQHVEVRTGGI